MAKQKKLITEAALTEDALIKEVCRRIRVARSYWDAHNNAACRGERDRALELYNTLTKEQKDQIPQVLRVWLRYRSEKYFGADRTPPANKVKPQSKRPPKRQK
jgi:hypothetical protein